MAIQLNPNIVVREIGKDIILVPFGQSVDDLRHVYSLNETAAIIFRGLLENKSEQEILCGPGY